MEQNQEVEKKWFSQAHENKRRTENIEQKTASRPFGEYYLIIDVKRTRDANNCLENFHFNLTTAE